MGIMEALVGSDIETAKKDALLTSIIAIGSASGLDELYDVLRNQHDNNSYAEIMENIDLFSVTYDPSTIKHAIEVMVNFLDGETVTKEDITPSEVVDAMNVQNFNGY
jgi:hypothetical protein